MLAPEYLAGLPDRLVAQYAAVERDILADMARRIREYDFYIPAAQHQRQRLRAMGLTEEEIEVRLSVLTGKSREELRKLMEQAAERSLSADAAVYAAAGMSTADPLAAAGVRAVLLSGLAQTGGVFDNLTRTTAHTAGKQFTDALDRAWLQIMSGGFDYHTAIRMAVKDLARQGMASVTYPSGHTDTLEVAVRRAVVTGCNQTAAKAQIALMDELGVELVETSAHAGARPSHAVWQGRIFCRHGRTDRYENFEEATGYGTGPGLCGWNCSHSFGPYIEGAPRACSPKLLARYEEQTVTYNGKDLTFYEAGQQQRYIERQIRRWKREYAAMDAAGLDTGEAAAKLSAWREREKDFCRQTGFKRQGERSQVAGARRVTTAERAKALDNSKKNATIPVERVSGVFGVKKVCDLDKKVYSCVTPDIRTSEVIITVERIKHIQERHPGDYERFCSYIPLIIADPDYILEDTRPNTAMVLKKISEHGEYFRLALRLVTPADDPSYKNSVITFLKIREKEWRRLTKNKKVLYKSE